MVIKLNDNKIYSNKGVVNSNIEPGETPTF